VAADVRICCSLSSAGCSAFQRDAWRAARHLGWLASADRDRVLVEVSDAHAHRNLQGTSWQEQVRLCVLAGKHLPLIRAAWEQKGNREQHIS